MNIIYSIYTVYKGCLPNTNLRLNALHYQIQLLKVGFFIFLQFRFQKDQNIKQYVFVAFILYHPANTSKLYT